MSSDHNDRIASLISYSIYDDTRYDEWNESVTEWVWDQITSGRFGNPLSNRPVELSAATIAAQLNDSGNREVTFFEKNGQQLIYNVPRTTLSSTLARLVAAGLLMPGQCHTVRELSKDTVRALMATRDSLDKLAALRLVMAESINEGKFSGAYELIENQRATHKLIQELQMHLTGQSPVLFPDLAMKIRRYRIRFARQSCAMRIALAEAANLGFLVSSIRIANRHLNLQYLFEETLAPSMICTHIEQEIVEHQQIYDAIVTARENRSSDCAAGISSAIDKNLNGTVRRWEQMAHASKKDLNISGFSDTSVPTKKRKPIESFIRLRFPTSFASMIE